MTENETQMKNLKKRLDFLEFLVLLLASVSATFLFGLTQILGVEWYPRQLFSQGLQFFGITFFTFNLMLFIRNTVEKIQVSFSSLLPQLWSQWKEQPILMKIVIALGLPSSLYGTISFVFWLYSLIQSFV